MRRLRFLVGEREAGRLDEIARAWLTGGLGRPLSKAVVRRLIMAGAIRMNGHPTARPGVLVAAGTTLDAVIDETRLPDPRGESGAPPVRVLYEDEAIIVVDKPPGLPVHRTADASHPDLYSLVRALLAVRARDGSTPYLGLHQRLDRDTSGIVLFTKRASANAGLAAQFEARSIEKVYHAITVHPGGRLRAEWRVQDELGLVGRGRTSRVSRVASGGQAADTSFAVLETFPAAVLVEARPHTGRRHQVRAHLSGVGMSIVGDVRYGGPGRAAGLAVSRPLLHARRLVLAHPVTGARLRIDADYPGDFLEILEALRAGRALTRPGRPR